MVFFVINFMGNMFRYNLFQWKKWPVLTLHLSWILIIIGAFITRYISFEGMMPIREGKTENVFYSDKTYLTAYVDGEIDGEPKRKALEDDLIVTPEALKSNLPWNSDYNGQAFSISYVDFIKGAKEGLVPDENGRLPRDSSGQLVVAANMKALKEQSRFAIDCVQIPSFPGINAGDGVEIAATGGIIQVHSLAVTERHRQPGVSLHHGRHQTRTPINAKRQRVLPQETQL